MSSPALVVRSPGDVYLEERQLGSPAPGQLVVRPAVVGLCGTDLEIVDGRIDPDYVRYPVVLGHEWSGRVVDPGPTALAVGAPVVVEGIVPCGHCPSCRAGKTNVCESYDEFGFTRDGAAAGAVLAPAGLVHPLAPTVDLEEAALVEPAAVVYRALHRANLAPGLDVLVVGDGTVGLLAAVLARLWTPSRVCLLGIRPEQAGLARVAGVDAFLVDRQVTGGYDVVVEAAGAPAAATAALSAVRRGGTLVSLGLAGRGVRTGVEWDDVVNGDLTVVGSFSYTASAWREVVGLLNAGRLPVRGLVTHRFPLERWAEALATLRHTSAPRGKVVFTL